MVFDPVVLAAVITVVVSGAIAILTVLVSGGVSIWLSLRNMNTQVKLNEDNLAAAKSAIERASKMDAYAKLLAAMEEVVECEFERKSAGGSAKSAREQVALTQMNHALAVIDLLAPQAVAHASTRVVDVIERERGDSVREDLLDATVNAMRADLGVVGTIRTLRRQADGEFG